MASEGKSGRTASPQGASKPKASDRARNTAHRRVHLDQEQQARLLLISSVVVVLLVALGFVAFGYWYTVIKPRNRTVLQVDSVKISYDAMKRRMGYEFFQNTRYQSQQGTQALPLGAYNALIDELTRVTRAESALGVTVDDSEFDQKLRLRIGVAPDGDQRAFADGLRKQLDATGLTEAEYRRLVLADVLNQKIQDKFQSELPATTQQARVEVISTQSKDDAQKSIDRINGGEDFATVAKSVSQETDAQTNGGLKDYAPKGTLNSAYDSYAFTADIGKLSDVIQGSNGLFYVVRVNDRSDQPITDAEKPNLARTQEQDWLQKTEDQMNGDGSIVNKFDTKTQGDAYAAIISSLVTRLVAQQDVKTAQAQQAADVRKTTVAQLTASPQAATPTPAPGGTPDAGATAPSAAETPSSGGSTPVVPLQPVAPGANGQ